MGLESSKRRTRSKKRARRASILDCDADVSAFHAGTTGLSLLYTAHFESDGAKLNFFVGKLTFSSD